MSRYKLIALYLLSLFALPAIALDSDMLLPPEQVFQASATAVTPNQIEINWTITDGYSLYRKNMRFEARTPDVQLGDPVYPAGKIKRDEILGDIEHYRGRLAIKLPLIDAKGATSTQLVIRYQGCADIGVCYPPQQKTLNVNLAPPTLAANVSTIDGLLSSI